MANPKRKAEKERRRARKRQTLAHQRVAHKVNQKRVRKLLIQGRKEKNKKRREEKNYVQQLTSEIE